tara:strand:+ start:495 stop:677 length:183 start_codon:yes stop_codon:yes gene_type:complete
MDNKNNTSDRFLSPEEATNLVESTQMNPTAEIDFNVDFEDGGYIITKQDEIINVRISYTR